MYFGKFRMGATLSAKCVPPSLAHSRIDLASGLQLLHTRASCCSKESVLLKNWIGRKTPQPSVKGLGVDWPQGFDSMHLAQVALFEHPRVDVALVNRSTAGPVAS